MHMIRIACWRWRRRMSLRCHGKWTIYIRAWGLFENTHACHARISHFAVGPTQIVVRDWFNRSIIRILLLIGDIRRRRCEFIAWFDIWIGMFRMKRRWRWRRRCWHLDWIKHDFWAKRVPIRARGIRLRRLTLSILTRWIIKTIIETNWYLA